MFFLESEVLNIRREQNSKYKSNIASRQCFDLPSFLVRGWVEQPYYQSVEKLKEVSKLKCRCHAHFSWPILHKQTFNMDRPALVAEWANESIQIQSRIAQQVPGSNPVRGNMKKKFWKRIRKCTFICPKDYRMQLYTLSFYKDHSWWSKKMSSLGRPT